MTMTHLTEEQLEDVLQGSIPEPEHVGNCRVCRERLIEQAALRERLTSAFASVRAGDALRERIGRDLRLAASPAESKSGDAGRGRWSRWAWPLAAVAAAAVVVFALAGIYIATGEDASAAQAELVRIHQHNLSSEPSTHFYTDADPENVSHYLKTQLGFQPALPRLGQGMSLRGCCLAHFRGQMVGSYVVNTPKGTISIIVVTDPPETLGMSRAFEHDRQTFWVGSFAKSHMVAVKFGQFTYCAVGETSASYDMLTDILSRLVHPKP
jgi:hypothetical protein